MRLLFMLLLVCFALPVRAAASCEAGYFLNDANECEICPAGYYCPADTLEPEQCFYNDRPGVVLPPLGAASLDECVYTLEAGYYAGCMDGWLSTHQCNAGYYCPGGDKFTGHEDFSSCGNWGSSLGAYNCPFATYSDDRATECIPCPNYDNAFLDRCDINYGEAECEMFDGGAGLETCKDVSLYRGFVSPETASLLGMEFDSVTMVNAHGAIMVYTNINLINGSVTYDAFPITCDSGYMGNGTIYEPAVFNSVSDAIDGVCVPMDNIPDGTICGDLLGVGQSICAPCIELSPLFTHSDGARTSITDCYAVTNPGYYIQTDIQTYTAYETECQPGDYCPGDIRVRFNMETNSADGGNISCSTLGENYVLSDAGAASENMCYKSCDLSENVPEIENGTIVSADKAFWPNSCGYSVACNDGYEQINNMCRAVCNSGIRRMHTSAGKSFTLFAERLTSPALNVLYNNTVCYIPMFQGKQTNTINVNYNGQIYHAE